MVGGVVTAASLLTVPARATAVPVFTGVVQLPDGTPAQGAQLLLMPSLLEAPPLGEATAAVATATTDALGRFALGVPVTDEMAGLASQNGGWTNFILHVVHRITPQTDDLGEPPSFDMLGEAGTGQLVTDDADVDGAAGRAAEIVTATVVGLAAEMVDVDNGDGAAAFRPVNALALRLASANQAADEMFGVDLPPTSVYVGDEGDRYPETVDNPEGEPLPDTISGSTDPTAVPMPMPGQRPDDPLTADVPEEPDGTHIVNDAGLNNGVLFKDDPGEAESPSSRCLESKNWLKEVVYRRSLANSWMPVGEVHTSTDETITFSYGTKASTEIGFAYKFEGKGWKQEGGQQVRNTAGAEVQSPTYGASFARRMLGEFVFWYEDVVVCPDRYYGDPDDPRPAFYDRITAKRWTIGLAADYVDISQYDQYDDWEKALAEGRTATVAKGMRVVRDTGKGFTYTASGGFKYGAFGVTLSTKTDWSDYRKIEYKMGTTREWYHLFGNDKVPAESQIVYAYS